MGAEVALALADAPLPADWACAVIPALAVGFGAAMLAFWVSLRDAV